MSLLLENLAQAIPAIGPDPKIASQIFSSGGITVSGVMQIGRASCRERV